MQLMDELYQHPFMDSQRVMDTTGVSKNTAYKLIAELQGMGVLYEATGLARGKYYRFRDYLDLYKK